MRLRSAPTGWCSRGQRRLPTDLSGSGGPHAAAARAKNRQKAAAVALRPWQRFAKPGGFAVLVVWWRDRAWATGALGQRAAKGAAGVRKSPLGFPVASSIYSFFVCFPCFCTPCASPSQSCSSDEGSPSSMCQQDARACRRDSAVTPSPARGAVAAALVLLLAHGSTGSDAGCELGARSRATPEHALGASRHTRPRVPATRQRGCGEGEGEQPASRRPASVC